MANPIYLFSHIIPDKPLNTVPLFFGLRAVFPGITLVNLPSLAHFTIRAHRQAHIIHTGKTGDVGLTLVADKYLGFHLHVVKIPH